MIACQAVVGVVAGAPNLVEEVADLARDDALVLQATQQVGLFLSGEVNRPTLEATSWASSSASCRSFSKQVLGSSGK